jgi:hypothetical protein
VNELESKAVKPFYLRMMGLSAVRHADGLQANFVVTARTVSVEDVRWLLGNSNWRPMVMGAWFSLAVPPESIMDALLAAMAASKGSLTAPPLAAAAAVVAGDAAVPAMTAYVSIMSASEWADGSQEVVAAAVEHLGADPGIVPSDTARIRFQEIRQVATSLRAALTTT